jgi:hypothetical protein
MEKEKMAHVTRIVTQAQTPEAALEAALGSVDFSLRGFRPRTVDLAGYQTRAD